MMCNRSFVAILLGISFAGSAFGAIPPKSQIHQNILRGQGALQGGHAGSGFSLLDVKSVASAQKKTERLIISMGDRNLKKWHGPLGYYNVELEKDKKLSITFAQTLNSQFDQKQLLQKLKKSLFVQQAQIHFDPLGQNLILEMTLKKPVAVRVLAVQDPKDTGKVVLDFAEDRKR